MSPTKPRLFVSHSSQDAALTTAVSNALATASGGHPGFELLVDTACLHAGDDWPDKLHAMMAYAHAGLILFTRSAITRPWVHKETYILTWRRSLDPDFQLFYALLDGVTREELTKQLEPAHLKLIQALSATDPAAIAAEVLTYAAPPVGTNTPFETLRFFLSQNLKLEAEAVDKLAGDLGSPAVLSWLPGSGNLGVARIAERVLAGQFGPMKNLTTFVNTLKALGVNSETLSKVMRWVAPYWVPPEAASRLAATTEELETRKTGGLAAINGKNVVRYTAKMFVDKAHPFRFEAGVAPIESPTHKSDAEYYTGAICKAVRKLDLARPFERRVGYPDVDEELIDLLKSERPRLFVPIRTPDEETLRTLRETFPTVVFLLWTGDMLEQLAFDLPVVLLEPAVDSDRENGEYAEWRTAMSALGA